MELVGLEPTTSCMPCSLADDRESARKAETRAIPGRARPCGLAGFTGASPEVGHWRGAPLPKRRLWLPALIATSTAQMPVLREDQIASLCAGCARFAITK